MMNLKFWQALFVGLVGFWASTASADEVVRVMLFGGSSVRTSYIAQGKQQHQALEAMLREAYPQQKIEVRNWADNGESIARYLVNGTYERHRSRAVGMDIAIMRFGTNDQKLMKTPEYENQLRKMIQRVQEDFPGVQVILETGIYVDYPKHYSFDRNQVLNPYWEVARKIARDLNLPLVEYYEASKRETEQGNWDLRIRNIRRKGPRENMYVLDASEDAGKENDPKWFTDIHPNLEGIRIAAREQLAVIRSLYPKKLPSGHKAVSYEARDQAFYSELLNFDPVRLQRKRPNNPERDLQEATPPSKQEK